MPYEIYKIIHLTGIIMTVIALGGLSMHAILGGEKRQNPFRKPAMITHGVGLLFVLVGGFGMLARLGIHWPWPTWVIVKFAIWLTFGAAAAMVYRKPVLNHAVWWGSIVLVAMAATMAIMKPFV
jgi:hypothetical protein